MTLLQQTFDQLYALNLTGMAQALQEQLQMPDVHELSFEDRLALLLDRERSERENRRLQRLLKQAKLRLPASVEDIDFRRPRGLDRSVILRLASCEWVREYQNVLVIGPTGVGKTFIACALAQAACRQGHTTRYYRLSRLLGELALARADGSYPKLLQRLEKTALLCVDDFGLAALSHAQRHDLLEVLEDRYARRATLVTSQLGIQHWHEAIGEPTLADAILDRLVHGAHKLVLKGPSMRKIRAAGASGDPDGQGET